MFLFYTDDSASLWNAQCTNKIPTIDDQFSKETLANYNITVVITKKCLQYTSGRDLDSLLQLCLCGICSEK